MAKKPTYEQLEAKVNFYEYSIEESRKEVRKALSKFGIWDQAFHENEVVAITAVFLATKEELDNKGDNMKPHIKPKNGELWIFSSKKSSLDCLPLYKCLSMNAALSYLNKLNKRV